jgi:hypothetical protein
MYTHEYIQSGFTCVMFPDMCLLYKYYLVLLCSEVHAKRWLCVRSSGCFAITFLYPRFKLIIISIVAAVLVFAWVAFAGGGCI